MTIAERIAHYRQLRAEADACERAWRRAVQEASDADPFEHCAFTASPAFTHQLATDYRADGWAIVSHDGSVITLRRLKPEFSR